MEDIIKIKGSTISRGKTTLCVPIVGRSQEDILESVRQLVNRNVPMIEWRMDRYAHVMDLKAVENVLNEMAALVTDTVLLCTFRSKAQGGEKSIGQQEYKELNMAVAGSGKTDMLDLEYFGVEKPAEIIEQLHSYGVKVITSHHDFRGTPSVGMMKEQLLTMLRNHGDIAKLAVMPKDKTDVLKLMEAVLQVRRENPKGHVAAMSMGEDGMISRLLGAWFGSELTFGSFGEASAPGQIPFDDLNEIIRKIQESMGKR